MKEVLFDAFVSGDGSTGLGLYVVRQQSEALGGSCGVRDNPGKCQGSTFWFRIPYKPVLPQKTDSAADQSTLEMRTQIVVHTVEQMGALESTARQDGEDEPTADTILLIDDTRTLLELHAEDLR